MTGGRIKRVAPYIGNETFMMTYGDGVSNVDITELVRYHKKQAEKLPRSLLPSHQGVLVRINIGATEK